MSTTVVWQNENFVIVKGRIWVYLCDRRLNPNLEKPYTDSFARCDPDTYVEKYKENPAKWLRYLRDRDMKRFAKARRQIQKLEREQDKLRSRWDHHPLSVVK